MVTDWVQVGHRCFEGEMRKVGIIHLATPYPVAGPWKSTPVRQYITRLPACLPPFLPSLLPSFLPGLLKLLSAFSLGLSLSPKINRSPYFSLALVY